MFSFSTIPILSTNVSIERILFPYDSFDIYTVNSNLRNLNFGFNWGGSYVSRNNPLGIQSTEDFESYTTDTDLSGLNGGTSWNGPYVSR